MRVDALGKAFGGVVAVGILLIWWTHSERQRDADLHLVADNHPRAIATTNFLNGDRAFYESWLLLRNNKDTIGEWRLPGENDIPEELLSRYPARIRIERSWHLDLSDHAEQFSRTAWGWATTYNRRLAELITQFETEPDHAKNAPP